jgi:lipoate-protein ligase A
MEVEQFFELLIDFYRKRTEGLINLTRTDIKAVDKLIEEKYNTWEWNYGHSPAYGYHRSEHFPFGTVDIRLSVDEGVIQKAHIFGDFFGVLEIAELEAALTNVRHEKESVRKALEGLAIDRYIQGITAKQFLNLF